MSGFSFKILYDLLEISCLLIRLNNRLYFELRIMIGFENTWKGVLLDFFNEMDSLGTFVLALINGRKNRHRRYLTLTFIFNYFYFLSCFRLALVLNLFFRCFYENSRCRWFKRQKILICFWKIQMTFSVFFEILFLASQSFDCPISRGWSLRKVFFVVR